MKKVMLFSRDPGGANTVIPLQKALLDRGYEVKLYGKDAALKRYQDIGLCGIDISGVLTQINADTWLSFLRAESPDFIITGTSGDDFSERFLWQAANLCGIKSMAILDQWINYGIRFSAYSLNEQEKYAQNKFHPYLPDRILVMDEEARKELIKAGIEHRRVLVSGQPYFDLLLNRRPFCSGEQLLDLRQQLGCGSADYLITFISEPISSDYAGKEPGQLYWGYDEKTVFYDIAAVLGEIAATEGHGVLVAIKLHPREAQDNYNDVQDEFSSGLVKARLAQDVESWPLLMASDLVCGMSSMLLLEAVLLGCPVLSVQLGLKRENPLVLARRGIIETVLDKNQLQVVLRKILVDKDLPVVNWPIKPGAVERVIACMEELLFDEALG